MAKEDLFPKIANLASKAKPVKIDIKDSVMQKVRELPPHQQPQKEDQDDNALNN